MSNRIETLVGVRLSEQGAGDLRVGDIIVTKLTAGRDGGRGKSNGRYTAVSWGIQNTIRVACQVVVGEVQSGHRGQGAHAGGDVAPEVVVAELNVQDTPHVTHSGGYRAPEDVVIESEILQIHQPVDARGNAAGDAWTRTWISRCVKDIQFIDVLQIADG